MQFYSINAGKMHFYRYGWRRRWCDVIMWYGTAKERSKCTQKNTERSALFQHFKFALSVGLCVSACENDIITLYSNKFISIALLSFFCAPLQFHWTHFRHEWASKSEWESSADYIILCLVLVHVTVSSLIRLETISQVDCSKASTFNTIHRLTRSLRDLWRMFRWRKSNAFSRIVSARNQRH